MVLTSKQIDTLKKLRLLWNGFQAYKRNINLRMIKNPPFSLFNTLQIHIRLNVMCS